MTTAAMRSAAWPSHNGISWPAFRSLPAARRAGLRLLDYRRLVTMMHGAQAGSWSALQALFALEQRALPARAGARQST